MGARYVVFPEGAAEEYFPNLESAIDTAVTWDVKSFDVYDSETVTVVRRAKKVTMHGHTFWDIIHTD